MICDFFPVLQWEEVLFPTLLDGFPQPVAVSSHAIADQYAAEYSREPSADLGSPPSLQVSLLQSPSVLCTLFTLVSWDTQLHLLNLECPLGFPPFTVPWNLSQGLKLSQ